MAITRSGMRRMFKVHLLTIMSWDPLYRYCVKESDNSRGTVDSCKSEIYGPGSKNNLVC